MVKQVNEMNAAVSFMDDCEDVFVFCFTSPMPEMSRTTVDSDHWNRKRSIPVQLDH